MILNELLRNQNNILRSEIGNLKSFFQLPFALYSLRVYFFKIRCRRRKIFPAYFYCKLSLKIKMTLLKKKMQFLKLKIFIIKYVNTVTLL